MRAILLGDDEHPHFLAGVRVFGAWLVSIRRRAGGSPWVPAGLGAHLDGYFSRAILLSLSIEMLRGSKRSVDVVDIPAEHLAFWSGFDEEVPKSPAMVLDRLAAKADDSVGAYMRDTSTAAFSTLMRANLLDVLG